MHALLRRKWSRAIAFAGLALGVAACGDAGSDIPSDGDPTISEDALAKQVKPRLLNCSVLVTVGQRQAPPLWRVSDPYDADGLARIDFTHPLSVGGKPVGTVRGTITSRLTGTFVDGFANSDFAVSAEVTLANGEILRGDVAIESTDHLGAFLRQKSGALVGSDALRQPPPGPPGSILIYTPCAMAR